MSVSDLVNEISSAENDRDWSRLAKLFHERASIVHPGIGAVIGRDANVAVIQFIVGALSGYTWAMASSNAYASIAWLAARIP